MSLIWKSSRKSNCCTTLLCSVFFQCINLVTNLTITTWSGSHMLHRTGLSQASFLQPCKTSCPSWKAVLGLSLTATTSDALTLSSCCHLSLRARPPGPSAVARGAATLWKISKGHHCEEQEWDSFVRRLQVILMHIAMWSLDSHPLRKRLWKLGMFLFPFKISTIKISSVGRQVAPASPLSRGVSYILVILLTEVTFFWGKIKMVEVQARPTADTPPHLFFSCLLENMPAAISHLTALTRYGLNGENQPRREHFLFFFTQKSMQQYG